MPGFSIRRDDDEEVNAGIWTPYGPEPTDEERKAGIVQEAYKIRLLTPKRMDHYRKMATTKKWVNNQRVEEQDQNVYSECMYDDIIEDWEGVYLDEEKTQPAPCTLEYKVLLMKQSLDRQNFIILQGSLYANDDAARKAAQRDNFRQAHPAPARSPAPGLHDMPAALSPG